MKAVTAITNNTNPAGGVSNGRVSRRNNDNSEESAEIKMYLSKLKDLVPFMPKNRKLSKLEIIQNVIDYICDLQSELETQANIHSFDAAAALLNVTSSSSEDHHFNEGNQSNSTINNINRSNINNNSSSSHYRKPLVDRSSPNTILSDSEVHQQNLINNQQLIHSHMMTEKST